MTAARCRRSQAGVSVIEMTVALLLMASVVAVLGPMMIAAMSIGLRVQAQSENLDEPLAAERRRTAAVHASTVWTASMVTRLTVMG
jgi:hypothetical protein